MDRISHAYSKIGIYTLAISGKVCHDIIMNKSHTTSWIGVVLFAFALGLSMGTPRYPDTTCPSAKMSINTY